MAKAKNETVASNKRDVADIGGIPVYCRYDEAVDIDRVTGHPRNPNKHGDEQIALLAKIIKNSGWRNPICVSNRSGFVIKGHARLMAARVLGMTHVPVEYQDYATEAEEYQDMIADNRIAELAERDMGIIKDLLEELDTGANDMDMTGYVEAEIERLMTAAADVPDDSAEDIVGGSDPRIVVRLSFNPAVWLGARADILEIAKKLEAKYECTVKVDE